MIFQGIFFIFAVINCAEDDSWAPEKIIYRKTGDTAVFECLRPHGNTIAGKNNLLIVNII